ncbi:23S rRNA (uracil(747)-C(5))-methyltransferase RlmC [Marmoricola sp. RAF53]|uniref:23S rRNA (uracil(747)-C(5))-methyltransferase RlmC n=1 Tax=Marmoricola sp. RAF53 TaxID=3233059 RepID=UPI003F970682
MDCHHYDAGRCRSCRWLPTPYADQLRAKQETCAATLAAHPSIVWDEPVASAASGFRNKAKMVVSGTAAEPRLGILGADGLGVDIRDCGLHESAVQRALPVLAEFVTRAALTPYDVAARRGELKLVLVTASPDEELMVRFVTRSQEPVTRIRKHLPWLAERLPGLVVASVNLQPEHKAVVEGTHEIVLTEESALTMRIDGLDLLLRPQSFFQTNTGIATALYREAAGWVDGLDPGAVWDLYCGVGGFALHLAEDGRRVTGIESSAEAVASAQETARRCGAAVEFEVADATAWALARPTAPDLVVVNPPRRGIGPELAGWLDGSDAGAVLYSSCNPESLARDLAVMPGLEPVRARVFDMFPHTAHAEVLVLLRRRLRP